MSLKVLVACEESQAVCKEFRALGHEAYSCDIQDCSGGHPEWHIMEDVLPLLDGDCSFHTTDGKAHSVKGKWDLLIGFPPCFVAGTKVMTKKGIKNIEDVVVGDYVLTHKGRYKRVYSVMSKPATKIAKVQGWSAGTVLCTPNHRFYTNIVGRTHANRTNKRVVGDEFMWMNPTEFEKHTKYKVDKRGRRDYSERVYLTSICDTLVEMPKHKTLPVTEASFWYFLGKWVADGWFYRKGGVLYGLTVCDGKDKESEMDAMLADLPWSPYKYEKRTSINYDIYSRELAEFVRKNFGEYSYGKTVPGFVTRLPKPLAEAFLSGYLDADGVKNSRRIDFCTVSADLAYSIQYMLRKYHDVQCTVRKERQHSNIIEGRKVNTRPVYRGYASITDNGKQYLQKDRYTLYPSKDVEITAVKTAVYNLSVEDDESYTANGFIVHNCTHLAVSGARHFEKKRADGRQKEGIEFFCRFLTADCDHISIENPVNIISGDYVEKWFPALAKQYGLPRKPSQRIQPWMWGDSFSKTTCLWLKGLPNLVPDVKDAPSDIEFREWTDKNGKKKRQAQWYFDALREAKDNAERSRLRSKTFPGVAKAMASQWSAYLCGNKSGKN